jgi:alpha-L-fucosidase 2
MFYWPVYTANHLELLEPFHDWLIDDQLPAGRAYAKSFYGFDDGAYFQTATIGHRCFRVGMYATCNIWPAVGAWWCQHLWWAHLYQPSPAFLRDRAYPFMRQCMIFYEQLLEPGTDGKLHIPLTHSPEWQEAEPQAFCADSTIDLSLVRYAARAAISTAELLGLCDDAKRWIAFSERLPEYPVDENLGLQIYPGQNLTETHRHQSHLTPIFPSGDLNVDGTEEQRQLMQKSLLHLEHMGSGYWTGFGYAWAACIAARVGWGNNAWRVLDTYVGAFLSPNSFNLNGDFKNQGVSIAHYTPFTNEAGSGAAEAINQMLLQSWGGTIRLFPALPDAWREASFTDLRAEGAFLVSADLCDRRIVHATIRSEAGGACRVLNSFGGEVMVEGTNQVQVGEFIEFSTQAGGVYVIRPKAAVSLESPASGVPKERNFFGVKRTGLLVTPAADTLAGKRL